MQHGGISNSRNISKALLDDFQLLLVTKRQITFVPPGVGSKSFLSYILENKLLILEKQVRDPDERQTAVDFEGFCTGVFVQVCLCHTDIRIS